MAILNFLQIQTRLPVSHYKMKGSEDLQKGIQQLVDLTKQEDSNPNNLQLLKMPELALMMSKYFMSLSKLCLTHYHSYSKANKKGEKQKEVIENVKKSENGSVLPKKPLTAYIIYFQQRVPFFQAKHPTCTIAELTRLISKEWKQITEEAKRPYNEKAALDRKRYENENNSIKMKKNSRKSEKQRNIKLEDQGQKKSQSDKAKNSSEQPEDDEGI